MKAQYQREISSPYVLLQQATDKKPRKVREIKLKPTLWDLKKLLPKKKDGSLLAIDLETWGRDASDPETSIIGIGGADEDGPWYIDIRNLGREATDWLCERLRARPLTAFNVVFDWAFLWAKLGLEDLHWEACSYGLFRQIATEGFEQQRWGLGTLETDGLGWEYSNKHLLNEMLTTHGLSKDRMSELADLEPEKFGRYCAEDADAHWQAYEHLTSLVGDLGEEGRYLAEFHKKPWLTAACKINIEQQLRGIQINVPKLQDFYDRLEGEIEQLKEELFSLPEVAPFIQEYNVPFVEAHLKKEPRRWNLHQEILEKEPPRLTGAGNDSVRWKKWNEKKEQTLQGPEWNASWINWETKRQKIESTNFFNPNSPDQLRWLLFEKLGYPIYEYTDSGGGSTSKDYMMLYGETGRAIMRYKKRIKLRGSFVGRCLELQRDGVLHPLCKSVGTITGRAAGGQNEDG